MIKEAILHKSTTEYIYATRRNCLVFRIRVGNKDIKNCILNYWARTSPENKKKAIMKCKQRDTMFDYYEVEVEYSKVARYQKYYFEIEDAAGNKLYISSNTISDNIPQSGFFEFLYTNKNDVITIPEWAKGQIYYQIFPERFYDGDISNNRNDCCEWDTKPTRENYMGGDIRGITEKIPYLKELGISCIYLNPIFYADFNHKYATTNYYQVDPELGNNEDLRNLIQRCHENNIKILLDGVFNHVGVHFKAFEDLLEKQEKSNYKNWFHVMEYPITMSHHNYECVGAYKWMPKLDTSNTEVRNYIIKVMEFWIKEYHIDGWRLDVADEVDGAVWQEARLILKEMNPDILLLGETWGVASKLLSGNQMDIAMNYVFRDIMLDFFAHQNIDVAELDSRINQMLAEYHKEVNMGMYNLLDSHDTPRFLFDCGNDISKMKLAVGFQFLFIGAPAIFYGDEIGITGDNDPDCRQTMKWESEKQNTDLLSYYHILCKIRKEHNAIRSGDYFTIICDIIQNVFGFIRRDDEEIIYVVINNSSNAVSEIIPIINESNCYDTFTNQQIPVFKKEEEQFYNQDILECENKAEICLEPYSIKVIKQTYGGR